MHKICLPIDTKSLYMNILNDNESGHTATVSTPIKQGNSTNDKLMDVYKIPKQISTKDKPDLVEQLLKNAKSKVRINNIFIFNNIYVNMEPIEVNNYSFIIFIKEEIDQSKVQFGRIKLHYPITFRYEDDEVNINNKYIFGQISKKLNDYAFVVNSFEYLIEKDILNFNITIIGENKIPYSKVFVNNKGVGNKYTNTFNEVADSYDMEIISLKKVFGQMVSPVNYMDYMLKAKELSNEYIKDFLDNYGARKIKDISSMYTYSLYDFEYEINGKKRFVLVFYTASKMEYFNITSKKMRFLSDFKDKIDVIIISNVFEKYKISRYSVDEILNFTKSINSMMMRKEF